MRSIAYSIHHGPISALHRKQLLPLRLETFFDFPYLYVGNPAAEEAMWERFSQKRSFLILAHDGELLVGAAIATELTKSDYPALHKNDCYPLDHAVEDEMIMVAKSYQKFGIGKELLQRFCGEARAQGYTDMYGLVVVRTENHPLKPDDYLDLPRIWLHLGITPTGITEPLNWPTRCGTPGNEFVAPIDNMIQYWRKSLVQE